MPFLFPRQSRDIEQSIDVRDGDMIANAFAILVQEIDFGAARQTLADPALASQQLVQRSLKVIADILQFFRIGTTCTT